MSRKVAFILKGYPRLSETFIAQEMLALERRGLDLEIYSLRHPTDPHFHPLHREIRAEVQYLPEYLRDEPRRVGAGIRAACTLPGFGKALAAWLRDLIRDPSANRIRRFGQACVLATELPSEVGHLHAHFLHTPASVARYAAKMRGLAWSVSAHAVDIWTTRRWEKREKLDDAAFCATCTAVARDHLSALARRENAVVLSYHGIDLSRFSPPDRSFALDRDGATPARRVEILAIGRAVEKKGFDVLLEALARLDPHLHWRFTHIGGGAGLDGLKARAGALGLGGRVRFMGAQAFPAVLAAYRAADLFVLPCRIAGNGDRDGLPNVLLEAQSQSLPVISTAVSAIPELIVDGETGRLVAAEDAAALAGALEELIKDPVLRIRFGTAGADRVRREFSQDACIGGLAALFGVDAEPAAEAPVPSDGLSCESPSTHP